MLIITEEGEEEGEQKEADDAEGALPGKVFANMELKLTSIMGFTSSKTMKVVGQFKGKFMVALIDSGAMHNFISLKIVKEMGIEVQQTHYYSVTVADGKKIYSKDECEGAELELQGLKISKLSTLQPWECRFGFGHNLLESLGETRVNWRKLYMKVKIDKKWVCLRGDPLLT